MFVKDVLIKSGFICLVAGAAQAATTGTPTAIPYIPGNAPCNGVCSQGWARGVFGVPEGKLTEVEMPVGTVFEQMSYAKNGKAYASAKVLRLQGAPVRGKGYSYRDKNGEERVFMIIEEYGDEKGCQNWAIARPALETAAYIPADDGDGGRIVAGGRTPTGGGWPVIGGGGGSYPPFRPYTPVTGGRNDPDPLGPSYHAATGGEFVPTLATVPLPAAGYLFSATLLGLFAFRRRKTERGQG